MEDSQQEQTTTETVETPIEQVPKSELEKVLADMHRFKKAAQEKDLLLKKFEEQTLREKEDFKALADRYKAEAEEANEKLTKKEMAVLAREKHSAVRDAAIKAGILPSAVDDLDLFGFEGVVVEQDESGKVKVLGAEKYVQQLKQARGHWFGSASTNVNTSMPGITTDKPVNESELVKLSLEAQKSGDYTQYKKAQELFLKQHRK